MIHYFFGVNTYNAREAITKLAKEHNARITWLDREDLERQSLAQRVSQGAGGLFGRQLLVVRDVSRLPKTMQEEISRLTEVKTIGPLVVWDRTAPDKRAALWRSLKPYGKEFVPLPEPALRSWLLAEAKARGVSLEAESAALLITRLGPNQWRLGHELDKLSLLANPITAAHVSDAVPMGTVEAEVFTLLDALAANQGERALQQLENLLRSGEQELYILSMLAYQFRTLFLIRAGQAQAAGVHPYVIGKQAANAQRLSAKQVQDILAKILATDFAIKQGKIDPRTGLTMLVLGLARQAA